MNWTYLDPDMIDKNIFGFKYKIFAVKVAKWHCKFDIRGFRLNGWELYADLCEFDPRTGRELENSDWFIFAAKGE